MSGLESRLEERLFFEKTAIFNARKRPLSRIASPQRTLWL